MEAAPCAPGGSAGASAVIGCIAPEFFRSASSISIRFVKARTSAKRADTSGRSAEFADAREVALGAVSEVRTLSSAAGSFAPK